MPCSVGASSSCLISLTILGGWGSLLQGCGKGTEGGEPCPRLHDHRRPWAPSAALALKPRAAFVPFLPKPAGHPDPHTSATKAKMKPQNLKCSHRSTKQRGGTHGQAQDGWAFRGRRGLLRGQSQRTHETLRQHERNKDTSPRLPPREAFSGRCSALTRSQPGGVALPQGQNQHSATRDTGACHALRPRPAATHTCAPCAPEGSSCLVVQLSCRGTAGGRTGWAPRECPWHWKP